MEKYLLLGYLWLWFSHCIHYSHWMWALALLLEASAGSSQLPSLMQHQDVASVLSLSTPCPETSGKMLCIFNECVSLGLKVGLPVVQYLSRVETLQSPAQGLEKWTPGNCIIFLRRCFYSSYISTCPNSINTWYLLKLLLSNMSAKSRAPDEVWVHSKDHRALDWTQNCQPSWFSTVGNLK